MDFNFSNEQMLIKSAAADFAKTHLLPGVIERDELQEFPKNAVQKMAELGFMGITTSPNYGGAGLDSMAYVLALTEIAKIDASAAVIMSVNNSLVCAGLETYGSEKQKTDFLIPLAQGQYLGAFCLSEAQAGSDVSAISCLAKAVEGGYILQGSKQWISNAGHADVFIVIAQSDVNMGQKGMNAFVLSAKSDGISLGPKENKMGIRSSDTRAVHFDGVFVSQDQRIGPEGFGFKFAMNILNAGRLGIASQALGIAQGAYNIALAYAKTRETFGKSIIHHQAIAFKLAQMHCDIMAAQQLCFLAAWQKDQGQDIALAGARAKVFASETAMQTTTEAVQILGGYGFVKDYHVERMMRDAKVTQIYEGSSEIQKIIIAKNLSLGNGFV